MPARSNAAGTTVTSHLPPARLSRLRDLLVEERSAQLVRGWDLQDTLDFEPDVVAALLARCEETLSEVEEALVRLDQGGYGVCASCRTPIPFPRLMVVPAARWCVSCQSRRERAPR